MVSIITIMVIHSYSVLYGLEKKTTVLFGAFRISMLKIATIICVFLGK